MHGYSSSLAAFYQLWTNTTYAILVLLFTAFPGLKVQRNELAAAAACSSKRTCSQERNAIIRVREKRERKGTNEKEVGSKSQFSGTVKERRERLEKRKKNSSHISAARTTITIYSCSV